MEDLTLTANTLGSNPCTCVYGLDIKRPSCCSFDFLNSTTGGCFISLSIFLQAVQSSLLEALFLYLVVWQAVSSVTGISCP